MMTLNDEVAGRLYNWKFSQAGAALDTQIAAGEVVPTETERETIAALGRLFGNCGWFDGDMGVLVGTAVRSLTGEEAR